MNRSSRFLFWLLLLLLAAGMATLALNLAPGFGFDVSSGGTIRLVYLVAILAFLLSAIGTRRLGVRQFLNGVFGWLLIGVVALAVYAYRVELAGVGGRLLSVVAPGVPVSTRLAGDTEDSVMVMRAADGHFAIRTAVNGVPTLMLVDTGASFVTLTPRDAAAAGIDISGLAFSVPIQTANGMIEAAPVRIDRLTVGAIARQNVAALVAPDDALGQSLLGMSFLDTLGGYSISGDRLVLSP
jgi:aspartyl protease family protein